MIKVLFIISNLNPQGPIKQLFYLCKYLDTKVIEPIIVTTSQKNINESMHNEFEAFGIEIIDLELTKFQSTLKAYRWVQKIIDENNIDYILSFGFRSDIITSKLKRVYKITTVRNTLLFNWKMIWGKFLGSIFGRIHLYYIRKFDSIIACSKSVHNYLKQIKLDSDVIVNSIDTDNIKIKPNSFIIKEKKRLLHLPIDATICVTVSSKLKGKNIEFLINAFQNWGSSKKYLIVVGFVEPNNLKQWQNNNIIFTGKVDNLYDYLQIADFFISASLHEGMPNAVLEAMSAGIPVLLSDIPPHVEIFQSSNIEIGRLFKNNNLKDFYKSFNEIENSEYKQLSNNCIETIKEHFNASNMAFEYKGYFLLRSEINKINK